jgi:hypothetical protein
MSDLKKIYTNLYDYMNIENLTHVKKTLSSSNKIDITQDDCNFFIIPISRDMFEITATLIEYFFLVQLPLYENEPLKRKCMLDKLNFNLSEFFEEDEVIPKEWQDVFDKYESYGLKISTDSNFATSDAWSDVTMDKVLESKFIDKKSAISNKQTDKTAYSTGYSPENNKSDKSDFFLGGKLDMEDYFQDSLEDVTNSIGSDKDYYKDDFDINYET